MKVSTKGQVPVNNCLKGGTMKMEDSVGPTSGRTTHRYACVEMARGLISVYRFEYQAFGVIAERIASVLR